MLSYLLNENTINFNVFLLISFMKVCGSIINTRVAVKRLECRAVSETPRTDYDKQKNQIYQSLNKLRHLSSVFKISHFKIKMIRAFR